jgi:hypothetical protein
MPTNKVKTCFLFLSIFFFFVQVFVSAMKNRSSYRMKCGGVVIILLLVNIHGYQPQIPKEEEPLPAP